MYAIYIGSHVGEIMQIRIGKLLRKQPDLDLQYCHLQRNTDQYASSRVVDICMLFVFVTHRSSHVLEIVQIRTRKLLRKLLDLDLHCHHA